VSSTARRTFPRSRGIALASGLVLTAGLLAGAAAVAAEAAGAGAQSVSVHLGYSCRFPSGDYPVSAVIAVSLPATVAAGKPIDPTGLRVRTGLPPAAVSYLSKLGATMVSASESVTVIEASRQASGSARWATRTSASYPLQATGGLSLAVAGTASPVAASTPGIVTFSAADLVLTLVPRQAGGAATSPATVEADCAPASGTPARLASVTVTAASKAAGPAKRPAKHKYPPGCGDIKVQGSGTAVCGYLTGYADVAKLYGAVRLGPVLVNVDFAYKHAFKHGELIAYSKGELDYHGKHELPPVRPTFLSFRFAPVTATLELIELSPVSIVSASQLLPPYRLTVTATTTVAIHVSDVTVNGVALKVGARCRPEKPVTLKLIGLGENTLPPVGYTVPTGGPLTGFVTISPFVDCGVTENLDPLLTGTISGPGNYVKMTQGKLCSPTQPQNWTCPPPIRKPIL
jgi:hypothetical protein